MAASLRQKIAPPLILLLGAVSFFSELSSFLDHRRMDQLGATTEGQILHIRIPHDRANALAREGFVEVSFAPQGQAQRTREFDVSMTFAQQLQADSGRHALTVRYLPHDPDTAEIVGGARNHGWGMVIGLIWVAACTWWCRFEWRQQ
jgi:hypothetical protein